MTQDQGKPARKLPGVFLVGDCNHLTVGKTSIIRVQLYAPGEDADWGDVDQVELGVSLGALFVDCGDGHIVKLQKLVNPEPVSFEVVPEKPGNVEFSLRIFWAKQMILAQRFTFTLSAV